MIVYYYGTKFTLFDLGAYLPSERTFILAESPDKEYIFQIISIGGYAEGRIEGYVKIDPVAEVSKIRGVTQSHLTKEIKRNFLYEEGSLIIVPSHG